MRGTGGGRGQELASHEQVALDCMSSRGSHIINGIDGGFETSLSLGNTDSSGCVILADDTQTPSMHRDVTGKFVDADGNIVDLTKYGVNFDAITSVPETQISIDDETLDDIPCSQEDPTSMVPTQATVSCSVTQQGPQQVPTNGAPQDVIEISSGESSAKKRKLMSKEAESDFFEDHLLPLLDAGTT